MNMSDSLDLPVNKTTLFDLINNFNVSVEKFKQIEVKVNFLERVITGNPETDKPGLVEIIRTIRKDLDEVANVNQHLHLDIQNIKENLVTFKLATSNEVEGLNKETSGLNSKVANYENFNLRLSKVEEYMNQQITRPARVLIWVPLLTLFVTVIIQLAIPLFKLLFKLY